MATSEVVTEFLCPKCSAALRPVGEETRVRCDICSWRGLAFLFEPLTVRAQKAEQALPDDAVCVHHPSKRAECICEGTGDYICALCTIELDGKTYSAQYLSKAGKERASEAFDRHLPRPDREIGLYLLLCVFFFPAIIVWAPFAIYWFFRMLSLRNKNPLYRKVLGRGEIAVVAIIIAGVILTGGIIAVAILLKAAG